MRTWNCEISEDLAQTTFVKAFAGLDGWHDQGKNPLAYFFTIARNALIDHCAANGTSQLKIRNWKKFRAAPLQLR